MSDALQVGLMELAGRSANGGPRTSKVQQRVRPSPQSLSRTGTSEQRQCRSATQGHLPPAHQGAFQGGSARWGPPAASGAGSQKPARQLSAAPRNGPPAAASSGNGAAAASASSGTGAGTGRRSNGGSSRSPASPGLGMPYPGINASVLASAESPESAAISSAGQGLRPRVLHHVPAQADSGSLAHLLLLMRSISNSTGLSRSASAPDEAQLTAVLSSLPGWATSGVPEGGPSGAEEEAVQYRVEAEECGAPLAPVSHLPRTLRMVASELSPESLEVLAGPCEPDSPGPGEPLLGAGGDNCILRPSRNAHQHITKAPVVAFVMC